MHLLKKFMKGKIMKKSEIREILKFMNSLYPNRKMQLDDITVTVWYEMLNTYQLNDVKKAILSLAHQKTYIPNLPEIVQSIQPSCTVEIETLGNRFIVYVRYPDAMYPFKFESKTSANNFLKELKTKSSDEEVIYDLYRMNLSERSGYFETTIRNIPISNFGKRL